MAGSSSSVKIVPLDPDYIKFLLDPDLGCYFVVKNAELAPVEEIGVVRKMLAAHSSVFRAQLLNRQWESKKPEEVTDILPITFKNLLRFVYGYDTTATMSFEDADDLLYAADRYIMERLKDKLAARLMSLLDYTNICSLLTNPACASVLDLHSEMTKILQCETDKVLASSQFLSCSPETFVKILEQEEMNITELEVWRASIRWAKNKAKKEDAKFLRQQLAKPLKHIRVCSLSLEELGREVIPTGILAENEVGAVCNSVVTKKKPVTLTTICNNMQVRRVTASHSNRDGNRGVIPEIGPDCVKSQEIAIYLDEGRELGCNVARGLGFSTRELNFSLQTHNLAIELMKLDVGTSNLMQAAVTVNIESTQATITNVTHTGNYSLMGVFTIPVSTEQRPVVLSPNTQYSITLSSDTEFSAFTQTSATRRLQHFTLQFQPRRENFPVQSIFPDRSSFDLNRLSLIGLERNSGRGNVSPVTGIYYKTLTPQLSAFAQPSNRRLPSQYALFQPTGHFRVPPRN